MHTPTSSQNNTHDAFLLLCQVAFYNYCTMEKLITVDLESWLIDHVSVLIASLLPEAFESPPVTHTYPLCFKTDLKYALLFLFVVWFEVFIFSASGNYVLDLYLI